MTPAFQKMFAASVLPTAMTVEITAHIISLVAANTRSFLDQTDKSDTPRLAAPVPAVDRSTLDTVGALAVPPAGSLPG